MGGVTAYIDAAALRVVAEELAIQAAAFVRRRRPEVFAYAHGSPVRSKSTRTDPVTVVDTESERLLRDRLAAVRPGEAVLGEEGGGSASRQAEVTWVLDPIDGTVNFVYGIPAYAVSVAAQVDGVSVAGAVADVSGRCVYSAAQGLGAQVADVDGQRTPLRCNRVDDLAMALVGTGFGYAAQRRAAQAAVLAGVLPAVRDVRRIGSAALDLCMVAAGQLDAHYEHGLRVWDWAAGALIAAEAGAVVHLPAAGSAEDALTVAAAPGISAQLVGLLARLGAAETLPDRGRR
ncbi:MAG TPA: inositol monophosphatase family protein [Mycobacterium sp.]|nr:inositol monophosphatase family protein [Mycobacterium sp.]